MCYLQEYRKEGLVWIDAVILIEDNGLGSGRNIWRGLYMLCYSEFILCES
jgi:hypothetical protein